MNTPQDSLRLRALQVLATKIIAQTSGNTIAGAIDSAISDGFGQGAELLAPDGAGFRFNFPSNSDSAQSVRPSAPVMAGRIGDAFAAIDKPSTAAAPVQPQRIDPRDWLFWADVRGAGIDHWSSPSTITTIYGNQVNALLGLTRRITPDFLIGMIGGYEFFDYASDTMHGRLKGGGWTAGSYAGWKILPTLRSSPIAA